MQMAGIPYTTEVGQFRVAPYKQLPYIEENGHRLADSENILDYLNQKYGHPLDKHLSSQERQLSRLLAALFENSLYWVIMRSRFEEKNDFSVLSADVFEPMIPPMLRSILPWFIRRGVLKQIHAVGLGRLPMDEAYRRGIADIVTVTQFLGAKSFFLGERPSTIDAIAYGFLANILWYPLPSPLKQALENRGQLVKFCERVRETYFIESQLAPSRYDASSPNTLHPAYADLNVESTTSVKEGDAPQKKGDAVDVAELERQFELARMRYQAQSSDSQHQNA